ncbi:MAG: M20/M25/M40 family metallo-hydrolase [Clostridia bacterium]|nr:M20/M25/M40 family metallo-hydrolase [Clostridia bacterium]MBQ1374821.1 M20/M25/M40 family metallo-hydrolase [Clostridia bacterium]MBQ1434842.1 M20/M25/M40 family metallo-hydrolase [Clostridia bacterium]
MDVKKIREKADGCLEEQVRLLTEYAKVDCESGYLPGNRKTVDMTREMLSGIPGIEMKEIFCEGIGTHLIARVNAGNKNGKIVLNAHLDTVFAEGFTAKYPPYRDDEGWLHGLGTGDCKAGVVISAYAVKIASELGLLPDKEIVFIYSCDEEIGSPTGCKVFEAEAAGAECAYVFEYAVKTDDGYGVVSQRDGVILGALDVKGVEAHAGGAYMEGHSAIKELAHKILKYYSFNDYEREIYYNVAPISGGRPNGIVAGDAHMEFCVAGLPTNESFKEAEANIESLAASNEDPFCTTTVEHHILFPALEKNEAGSAAVELVKKAGEAMGIKITDIADPTATDACWFYYYGVPALDAFGAIQQGIHTTEEKVYIPSIAEMTALFTAVLGTMKE